MMLILKLPIAYLVFVVWWAVRAEPKPPEPAIVPAVPEEPEPRTPWQAGRRRKPRSGPHGGAPRRGYVRTRRAARA